MAELHICKSDWYERTNSAIVENSVQSKLTEKTEGIEEINGLVKDNQANHNGKVWMDTASLNEATLQSCLLLRTISSSEQRVMFFDLDNTLYSKQLEIAEEMCERIQLYFETFLHLPKEECLELGRRYYLDYGLAIKGLITNFGIDPESYDSFVDGGLQLESKLKGEDPLEKLLGGIRARKWVFTNAGLRHTRRVLRLLQIEEHFEGIVYCNYCEPNFPAKPDRLAFQRAMQCAGVNRPEYCWFVDDNKDNVRTALEVGWNAVHLEERHEQGEPAFKVSDAEIREISRLNLLEHVFPDIFKS